MQEFFYMGGYGLYVWLAYGMATLIISFNLVKPWMNR